MKKVIVILIAISLFSLTGCEKVTEGKYKEGTYFASTKDTFGGKANTATAVITIDKTGLITSVFLDTTYTKDEVVTTKKALGKDYNMVVASPIGKEWNEQVKILEDKIVSEQGLDWLKWKDAEKTTTDSVSGVTLKINALYKAVDEAISKAK